MDDRKEIVPSSVVSPTAGHMTAAELMKLDQVPRDLMPPRGEAQIIYVQEAGPPAKPEYRGDDLLRRFVPYFVITVMGLVLLGGIIGLLGLVVPLILSAVLAVVASFVSIVLSLVATIIAGVVIALGIAYCQTVNARQGDE